MGYYTSYELEAEPWPDSLSVLIESHAGIFNKFAYYINPDGSFRESGTWYEHERDMREVSKMFPNVELILIGEGEEVGDAWIKHFRDGKMQARKAELVYPEYDPEKFE